MKTMKGYAGLSAEAIGDALLTVEGWFEHHQRTDLAKISASLFEEVWRMLDDTKKQKTMNRNTVCMLSELQPGDRFYFAADRKRTPWQVFVEKGEYKANMVAPGFVDGFGLDAPKWFKPQTQVVFLRHTAQSDIAQESFKLPGE